MSALTLFVPKSRPSENFDNCALLPALRIPCALRTEFEFILAVRFQTGIYRGVRSSIALSTGGATMRARSFACQRAIEEGARNPPPNR